jgi:hypothetical protein
MMIPKTICSSCYTPSTSKKPPSTLHLIPPFPWLLPPWADVKEHLWRYIYISPQTLAGFKSKISKFNACLLTIRSIPSFTNGWSNWRHINFFFLENKSLDELGSRGAKVRADLEALRALREELTVHPSKRFSHRQQELNPPSYGWVNSLSTRSTFVDNAYQNFAWTDRT